MWIRYHIECHNCKKVTNLRLHLTSKEQINIKFSCANCNSDLVGVLKIDYSKFRGYKQTLITRIKSLFNKNVGFFEFNKNFHDSLKLEFTRGKVLQMGRNEGDCFHEFSELLNVTQPSTQIHDKWTPTLRNPSEVIERQGFDSLKLLYENEKWLDLSDLVRAFQFDDKNNIEKITLRLFQECELLKNTFEHDFS
jgi:hypothetical protein